MLFYKNSRLFLKKSIASGVNDLFIFLATRESADDVDKSTDQHNVYKQFAHVHIESHNRNNLLVSYSLLLKQITEADCKINLSFF